MQIGIANSLAFLLTGGFLIFLAITVIRDNLNSITNRVTSAMLFFAGLGPLAIALGYIMQETSSTAVPLPDSQLINTYYFWELFFPCLLLFSWLVPIDRLKHFNTPRLKWLIVIPQTIHITLVISYEGLNDLLSSFITSTGSDGFLSGVTDMIGWLASQILLLLIYIRANDQIIFGTVNVLYVLTAIYFLEVGRKYLANPRLLTQTRIILWGMRIGLSFYLISYFVRTYLEHPDAATYSAYLLMPAIFGGGGFIAYAIIRHQFLNVQFVFRQSMIHTLISAILVGGYIFIAMRSAIWLEPIFGPRAELVSYLLIVLMLLLFQPISSWLDNIIRSMFLRTRTDYRNIVERFSKDVLTIFEPAQLRLTIEETLKTSLLVEKVYFVLFDDSVQEYAILQSEDYPRRTVIDREDMILRGINQLDTPSRYASLSDYQDGSRLGETLTDLNVRVILPLKDAEHLLGFIALSIKSAGYQYTAEDLNLLGVLSNQMVSALTNARLYADSLERLRLEEEVNMARQIQVDLLPSKPPVHERSVISASSTPSRTVGGDFYDFIPIDNNQRLGIVIADASGKGMPAALMVAQIQAIIRNEVTNGNPIECILRNLNNQIASATSSEKYATLFYAELDQNTGTLEYANAGHNYPLLVRSDGSVEKLDIGGTVIGAFQDIEYESKTIQLKDDDLLFMFTDGLSEAMDSGEVEYGEERIKDYVVECRKMEPSLIIEGILRDVLKHAPTTPPQDDTTLITIKMTNGNSSNVK